MSASVFIAVPAFGQTVTSETLSSLIALGQVFHANRIKYYFGTMSFPDIAELRNQLLTIWADKVDTSHILFVDADMGFEPELVLDMLAFGKPLVGALYPKKTHPIDYVGRGKVGAQRDGGFIEVEGIGFGVTLVHRSCVDAMLESGQAKSDPRLEHHTSGKMLQAQGINRIIRAFDPIETETGKLSEDLAFCRRHINSGGQVWAATHHRIVHVGCYGFAGRYADGMKVESAA